MKRILLAVALTASLCARCDSILPESLARASREAVRLVSEQLLSADPTAYKPTGCTSKPYGSGWYIHYATVSLGMTALQCARQAGDTNLEARLVAKFRPYCTSSSLVMNGMRHVDMSIVGALPLELAILTGDPEAARLGLSYADRQWEKPQAGMDFGERLYDPQPIAEREANFAAGYTPETRLWIDDMYMITALQSQAYRLTGERRYIDRAAKEMCLYLERLQRPDGLFNHGPDVPFVWGRGAGWMAAGMTLNLRYLPKDSPHYGQILAGYRKMMASLLAHQRDNGLWGQLVDDPESYAETSGSAMFAYAFAEGVKRGWLTDPAYWVAVVRAVGALLARLDEHGNLRDVCIGTGKRNDRTWYLKRPVCTGDPHGQAPLLWLLGSVLEDVTFTASAALRLGEICPPRVDAHAFELGEADFLLDGEPFVLRCGEIHYARIPRAYWRHRLQMLRAMGCNAVGCYMFWNFHEREPGKFTWEGRADAAAFCKLAQEEGLWVILRPGPYACAEWEGGGAPWWLMADDMGDATSPSREKKPISMRSSDPRWVEPAKRWIAEVGRQLAPLQITKGGPILMVQVENEYGLHGNDTSYIRTLRQATLDAGFEVPLYACNPPRVIQNGFVPELFQAANFGGDPEQRFTIVRQYQPKGPLMCSEYYPAWFDTWGQAHHPPKRDREFFGPIDWMLAHRVSFSLYMAHGGTSFGGWTGCRNPFSPNVTSYDYEAPINEHGAANPSFAKFRDRCAKYLNPGETIPPMPAPIPTAAYGTVRMEPFASLDALVTREVPLESPVYMEQLGQGFGLVSYERDLAADEGGLLSIDEVHDFGYVFLDGQHLGTLDRRHRGVKIEVPRGAITIPRREGTAGTRKLQIVLEPMGRINSSTGMEDRKGLNGCVRLGGKVVKGWTARMMPIDPDGFTVPSPSSATGAGRGGLSAPRREGTAGTLPTLYRGTLDIPQPQPSTSTSSLPSTSSPADTFIDMTTWTKGIVWVNGHNLGRFWSIGPQQTLYVPGCWLKFGENEVVILDFFGPRQASEVVFREKPILDVLQLETDFNRKTRTTTKFVGGTEVASGTFPNTDEAQVVMFEEPIRSTTFTFLARTTYDTKNLASIAEFDLLDKDGNPLTSLGLRVAGVDSEEEVREDGVAENAIDGQVEASWVTSSRSLPHWIEFQTPSEAEVYGFRYTPRQKSVGRIKDWSLFIPTRNLQAEIDALSVLTGPRDIRCVIARWRGWTISSLSRCARIRRRRMRMSWWKV